MNVIDVYIQLINNNNNNNNNNNTHKVRNNKEYVYKDEKSVKSSSK
jgi:hypothetical protein